MFILSLSLVFIGAKKMVYHTYFMLSTRAWEMLLGGLAFLYPLNITGRVKQYFLQFLGLLLIVVSYFVFQKLFGLDTGL